MKSFYWVPAIAAIVLAVVVGTLAFNAGVASGIEQSGKIVAAAPNAPYAPYPYSGWPRPWGFGFFFAPLFFFFLFAMIVRGLFWRGGWHRHHARCAMHERMWSDRPPDGGTAAQ